MKLAVGCLAFLASIYLGMLFPSKTVLVGVVTSLGFFALACGPTEKRCLGTAARGRSLPRPFGGE